MCYSFDPPTPLFRESPSLLALSLAAAPPSNLHFSATLRLHSYRENRNTFFHARFDKKLTYVVRGLPYMTSAKFSDFFTPSPLSLSQISWFCSFCLLFGEASPPTHFGRHIWKPRYRVRQKLQLNVLENDGVMMCLARSAETFVGGRERGRKEGSRGSGTL